MGAFFVYILKSSFCLVLFYLFYRLLLSRETFLRFNRLALLGIVILSVVIPLCEITTEEPVMLQRQVMSLESLFGVISDTSGDEMLQPLWLQLVLFTYIAGVLFFAGRIAYSFSHMLRIIWMGKKTDLEGGICLVTSRQVVAPFSWMKYVVISQPDLEENKDVILAHELAHIRAFHSLDLLLSEFCILLHWFNPASWLLKREIQNNHEYQADEQVILHGINAKKYQLLLIEKAVGSQHFTSMANSFNHSKLKSRITMMLKKKSNPWARLKYLYVLPLTACAIVAFARPEISRVRNNSTGQPIIKIDGKDFPYEKLSQMNPTEIESMSVWKGQKAMERFGEKGENGVIEIILKKR